MASYFDVDVDVDVDVVAEIDSDDESEEHAEEEKGDEDINVEGDVEGDVDVEEDIDDDEEEDIEEDIDDDIEDDDNQTGGAGEEDGSDLEDDDEEGAGAGVGKKATKIKKIPAKTIYKQPIDFADNKDEDEDEDGDGEQYLQKFDRAVNENYIINFHPESKLQNYDEILSMTKVVRNADGIVVDKLHRTIPYLTKYEKSRILGQRAKQINSGAYPFIKVPENVIDGYIIAEMELKLKRVPFIIRRPLPNGGSEYWKVQDLEDISF